MQFSHVDFFFFQATFLTGVLPLFVVVDAQKKFKLSRLPGSKIQVHALDDELRLVLNCLACREYRVRACTFGLRAYFQ